MKLHSIRKLLWKNEGVIPWPKQFHLAINRSFFIVQAFYAIHLFLVVSDFNLWLEWSTLSQILPQWPVYWVHQTGVSSAVHLIFSFNIIAAIGAMFFPEKRWARLFAAVAIFEFSALVLSFGKTNHTEHAWLWVALLFVFLPQASLKQLHVSVSLGRRYLQVFWSAQFLLLIFYTLTGFWKLVAGFYQFFLGETGAFSLNALAIHTAARLMETHANSFLGNFLIEHPLISGPFFWGAIYLECAAFFVAFRPRLHRQWGLAMILFHMANFLAMTINFKKNILVLALLFVMSPFFPEQSKWLRNFSDWPLIGRLVKRWAP